MYLSGVIRVRHIIKNDQIFVCKVSTYKIYRKLIHDEYLNRYTRIRKYFFLYETKNHIFNSPKLIDAHANEINMI